MPISTRTEQYKCKGESKQQHTRQAGLVPDALSCEASHALFTAARSAHRISFPQATKTSVPRRAIVLRGPGIVPALLALLFSEARGLAVDDGGRDELRAVDAEGENRPRPSGEVADSHGGVNARIFGIAARGGARWTGSKGSEEATRPQKQAPKTPLSPSL